MMSKIKWKNNWNSLIIYAYLGLPVLIFVFGWLRWYYALIFGALIMVAFVKSITDASEDRFLFFEKGNTKIFLITVALIVLWVILAGIGGYSWQNDDHAYRNAIFHALVDYDWPVVSNDSSRGLVYYIGFWLPAACIGKIFNIEAGYAFQAIWAIIGVFIVYYLICMYRKKVDIWPIIFLIIFSGLDYIGVWLTNSEVGWAALNGAWHIEWWSGFQFSSITTQLFWVFNQALPAWIATILILNQKNCKNMLFILSLVMLSSTFPFVGLIPIVIYLYVKRVKSDKNNWKEVITFQNVIGVVVIGGCIFLYLLGNIVGGKLGQATATAANTSTTPETLMPIILNYILFYGLEFGVYMPFICLYRKKDSLLIIIAVILSLCPFINVGNGGDFCMRASIPSIFILMVMCIDVLDKIFISKRIHLLIVYCIILMIGAITPFNEIHRTINSTIEQIKYEGAVEWKEVTIEDDVLRAGNFSGFLEDNIFYKYFAKDIQVHR